MDGAAWKDSPAGRFQTGGMTDLNLETRVMIHVCIRLNSLFRTHVMRTVIPRLGSYVTRLRLKGLDRRYDMHDLH